MAKRRKGQRMLCNTLHIKLKIEQHQPHSENIEHTQLVIRSRKSKSRQRDGQKKKDKTIIYKALHRQLKIEYH